MGLAGLGFLIMQQFIPAALFLVATAVLGVGAMIYRQGGEQKGPVLNGQRLRPRPLYGGRLLALAGVRSAPGRDLAGVREAAAQADLAVDTGALNILIDRAAAGNQTGDYAQAVRNYCQGISFLLAEFKRQGKSRPGGATMRVLRCY